MALSDERKYPVREFTAFAEAVRRYVETTKEDSKIRKSVLNSVNGLRDFIQLERKRVPGDIVFQADRLECLLFAGYDPSVEGDEPPGLESSFQSKSFSDCGPADHTGVR
jgi:hypothetical protein